MSNDILKKSVICSKLQFGIYAFYFVMDLCKDESVIVCSAAINILM